jgi:hypothetical protein
VLRRRDDVAVGRQEPFADAVIRRSARTRRRRKVGPDRQVVDARLRIVAGPFDEDLSVSSRRPQIGGRDRHVVESPSAPGSRRLGLSKVAAGCAFWNARERSGRPRPDRGSHLLHADAPAAFEEEAIPVVAEERVRSLRGCR